MVVIGVTVIENKILSKSVGGVAVTASITVSVVAGLNTVLFSVMLPDTVESAAYVMIRL